MVTPSVKPSQNFKEHRTNHLNLSSCFSKKTLKVYFGFSLNVSLFETSQNVCLICFYSECFTLCDTAFFMYLCFVILRILTCVTPKEKLCNKRTKKSTLY